MACDDFAESLRKLDDAWDRGLTGRQAYPTLTKDMCDQCARIYHLVDTIAPQTQDEVRTLAYIRAVINHGMVSLVDLVEELQRQGVTVH
jgi:hypothetical protein